MIFLAFYFIYNGTLTMSSNPRKFYVSEHRHLITCQQGCRILALELQIGWSLGMKTVSYAHTESHIITKQDFSTLALLVF